MAKKHFDSKGFPKLKEIIRELCGYVEGLEVEYTNFPFTGNVFDPEYGDRLIGWNVDFVQGIPQKPFKVNGIYVVGGQVLYLPDSYNTGEHDLDMVVKTNADRITFYSFEVEGQILDHLANVLENEKGCSPDRDKKEFVLDLFDIDRESPEPPYLQIYPVVKRVES